MRRPLTLAAAPLAAVALVGCGGIDDEDPEAVARALADANYRCDQEAVDQIRELTLPSKREPIEPRPDNCGDGTQLSPFDRETTQPVNDPPELEIASGPTQGDFVTVYVRELNDDDDGEITLVHTDDGWRWDPEGEPVP